MKQEAIISVVMPALNVAPYIRECLDSVIYQTLENIEIICVDAGSTDGTLEILEEYAQKDDRIRVIHSDMKSYGHQVNLGMDQAHGKYFAIVETDDIIHLKMYEELLEIAENTDVDIVKGDFCRFSIVDGEMRRKEDVIAKPHLYGRILTAEQDQQDIILNASLYTWSGIYRLDFLRNNGIRHNETPGASYQDNGFWFQTMAAAKTVYFVNRSYYMLRRDNPNSSINNKGKVYCIRDEYDFIYNFLCARPALLSQVEHYYWWARFGAYRYNYRRIALEYKEEFIMHFNDIFIAAQNDNKLDESIFSKTSWHDLTQILDNPKSYNKQWCNKENRNQQKQTYLNRMRWCYEDNGFVYTVKHMLKRPSVIINNRKKLKIKRKQEEIKKKQEEFISPILKRINSRTNNLSEKIDALQLMITEQNNVIQELIKENQRLQK